MPSTSSLPYLTSTQLSILMLSQISLMTSSTSVDSVLPFRRKDMQIADILQSTFVNTTNTLFLLDDNGTRARNFVASSTLAIIELAIKLFSHQKSSQIFALDNVLELLKSNANKIPTNKKVMGKTRTQSNKRSKSGAEWRHRRDPEELHSQFQMKWRTQHQVSRRTPKIKQPEKFRYHRVQKNARDARQHAELDKLTTGTPARKQMNLNLTRTTSVVIMLRNANALTAIKSFPINIPSLAKIVYLYDECMWGRENELKKSLQEFSEKFWLNFRILFTYFILFCSSGDLNNVSLNCLNHRCKGHNDIPQANKRTTTGMPTTSNSLWNLFGSNNTQILLENKNLSLVQSLYVYNPFDISDVENSSPNKRRNDPQKYEQLRKINLDLEIWTIGRNLHNTFRTIRNGNGQDLKVVAFTTPNTIQKADFPFLSHHLSPELIANPFKSLDAFVGVEILIIEELAQKMNFTIQLVPVTDRNAYGWKLPNGSFVGALGDLLYQRADVCMNGFFIKDYETQELHFTTSVQDDRICVAVRTPALIPRWLLLFKVFSTYVWFLLIMTFLVTSFLYTALLWIVNENDSMKNTKLSAHSSPEALRAPQNSNRNKRESAKGRIELEGKQILPFKSSNQSYNQVSLLVSQCFRIIAVLLNAPVNHIFNSSSYERIFVVLCLLLGLNLTGSFQGSLMDVYTTPREYPSIDTLEQLDKTGMLIILEHAGLQTDIFGTESPGSILGNLRKKIQVAGVPDDTLLAQIGSGEKFSALLRLGDFDRIKFKIPYRSDGKTLIHVIPDCPKTYNLAFLVNKSSDLYATINRYLGLIAAGGLITKWTRDSIQMFRLHGNLKHRKLLKDSQIILTLSHLQLAFFMLFIGLVISLGLFVGEITWERLQIKRLPKGRREKIAIRTSSVVKQYQKSST